MNEHPLMEAMNSSVSRRVFLRRAGIGATAVFATAVLGPQPRAWAAAEESLARTPAVLIDLTRCAGCESCALACKVQNGLPDPDTAPQALDKHAYTFVEEVQIETADGEGETRHVKRQCMHCLEPACVAACPAAAMYKSKEGPVVYRPNRCLGCRYCQVACPFDIPAFDWTNPITPRISKCWLCYDRLLQGQQPACVEACPTGALHFGLRDELLAQAHGRIASDPDRYVNHVYGEHEVGGTSMLYLSDVPFEELGFHVTVDDKIPPVQTEKVMQALPAVIASVGALAVGTAVYTHRGGPEHGAIDQDSDAQSLDHREQEG